MPTIERAPPGILNKWLIWLPSLFIIQVSLPNPRPADVEYTMREPSGEGAASTRKAEGIFISMLVIAPVAASTIHSPGFQPLLSIGASGPSGNIGRYKKAWLAVPGSQ